MARNECCSRTAVVLKEHSNDAHTLNWKELVSGQISSCTRGQKCRTPVLWRHVLVCMRGVKVMNYARQRFRSGFAEKLSVDDDASSESTSLLRAGHIDLPPPPPPILYLRCLSVCAHTRRNWIGPQASNIYTGSVLNETKHSSPTHYDTCVFYKRLHLWGR